MEEVGVSVLYWLIRVLQLIGGGGIRWKFCVILSNQSTLWDRLAEGKVYKNNSGLTKELG